MNMPQAHLPAPGRDASAPLLSEDAILACIGRHFPLAHPSLLLGRGDDCAILKAGQPLCMSSDLFLEDIHFRRSYFSPADIGHKALAVNISDIAACGARPLAFCLNLGLPGWVDMPWLEAFLGGMAGLARRYRLALAGGDLARCAHLHVSISIWGERPETGTFLVRGGSMPGDVIFVVGTLGLARVGLQVLEEHGPDAATLWPFACAAHLRPEPQVEAGLLLGRTGRNSRPPTLMDVSDGLLRDLPRLLGQSGELAARPQPPRTEENAAPTDYRLGASLVLPHALLHAEVIRHALARGREPALEALRGGEDYALLGSCAPDMLSVLHAAIPALYSIGTVTDDGVISCNNAPLTGLSGFDHFAGEDDDAHVR